MKVVEIKEELRKRKLSTSGVKAVLEARLNEAIEKEQAEKEAGEPDNSVENGTLDNQYCDQAVGLLLPIVVGSPEADKNEAAPDTAVTTSNDAVENPKTTESGTDNAAMDITKDSAAEDEKLSPDTEKVENGDIHAGNEDNQKSSPAEEKEVS